MHALNELSYATSGSYTSHCEFLIGGEATKVGGESFIGCGGEIDARAHLVKHRQETEAERHTERHTEKADFMAAMRSLCGPLELAMAYDGRLELFVDVL